MRIATPAGDLETFEARKEAVREFYASIPSAAVVVGIEATQLDGMVPPVEECSLAIECRVVGILLRFGNASTRQNHDRRDAALLLSIARGGSVSSSHLDPSNGARDLTASCCTVINGSDCARACRTRCTRIASGCARGSAGSHVVESRGSALLASFAAGAAIQRIVRSELQAL